MAKRTTEEILDHIANLLSQDSEEVDLAVNGVQVEGLKKEVASVATAVTASQFVIEEACRNGHDLLIVHHGLLLRGATRPIQGSLYRKLKLLFDHGITLLAYHLPLDSHPILGNAWSLPLDMGWGGIEPFCEYRGKFHLGVLASLPEPRTAAELAKELSHYFRPVEDRYHVVQPEKVVSRVAFVPGHGHKYVREALALGADCYITGTNDEPLWHLSSEEEISFLSFGHHATERRGVQKLGDHLQEHFQIRHVFYDEKNPF